MANAGETRNVIPASATAIADVRSFVGSIAPNLYLATRMVMDVGSGKVAW